MADFDDSEERTEEATEQRREEFRKKGDVAQTKELSSSFYLFALGIIIFLLAEYFFNHIFDFFNFIFSIAFDSKKDLNVKLEDISRYVGIKTIYLLGPFLFISLLIGISSYLIQNGIIQVENAFDLKFDRINPVNGFTRIFSLKSLVEGIKALLKFVLISVVTFFILKNDIHLLIRTIDWDLHQSIYFLGKISLKILTTLSLSILLIAGFDYFFQRWDLEKRMRMTKKELKDELKNREIDPLIKSRIRRLQKDLSQRRMMQKVPQADVVITNPTHIAVALVYSPEMPAPKLIAKGADHVAQKIREIAKNHGIPIVENKPLARTIFKTMKLDQFIPRELYVAVAEVLSYVYRLKKKKKGIIN